MLGRLAAWWLLSWAFVSTLLRRAFTRARGLERFRAAYAPDRLLVVGRDERPMLLAFSSCIACGRCDRGESARVEASAGEYPGLMPLVLASTRDTADSEAALLAWRHVPDDVLEHKEGLCPTGVPFRAMKRFVEIRARELAELHPSSRETP